jgi:hypothetical protein
LKRGRKQKSGERYPGGKLKPQPKRPPDQGTLLDYQLDLAREHIRKRVTDPIWWKRAGWLNLNQRLSDELTSAAFNFYTLFNDLRFVPPKRVNPHPRTVVGVQGTPTPNDDEEPWTSSQKVELVDRIKRGLSARELRAVKDYALEQQQPDNWDLLEAALTKVHCILNDAEPMAKQTIIDKRRSEFAGKDVPAMLEVRGLNDHERFVIAYASQNSVVLSEAVVRGAKLGVQRARKLYPDFDQYIPAITRLFDEGIVERTGNRDRDYGKAYKLAKYGQQQEENYKKWRKAGVAIGDDQSSGR